MGNEQFSEMLSEVLARTGQASSSEQFYGWHKFKTYLGSAGRVVSDQYIPIIYINGIQVDNKVHPQTRQQVSIIKTVTSKTSSGGGK
jgi:hypothetical protein